MVCQGVPCRATSFRDLMKPRRFDYWPSPPVNGRTVLVQQSFLPSCCLWRGRHPWLRTWSHAGWKSPGTRLRSISTSLSPRERSKGNGSVVRISGPCVSSLPKDPGEQTSIPQTRYVWPCKRLRIGRLTFTCRLEEVSDPHWRASRRHD